MSMTSGPHETDELTRWRSVGQRLWPYVRYFGLMGGEQQAVAAVRELADLLGLSRPGGVLEQEQLASEREQAIDDCLARVAVSLRGRILSGQIGPLCDQIRQNLMSDSP